MYKKYIIFIFLILNIDSLYASTMDIILFDIGIHIQKYLNYTNLQKMQHLNKIYKELFQIYIDQRAKKDMLTCIKKSPYMGFLLKSTILQGHSVTIDHKIIKYCIVEKMKNIHVFLTDNLYASFVYCMRNCTEYDNDYQTYIEKLQRIDNCLNIHLSRTLLVHEDPKKSIIKISGEKSITLIVPAIPKEYLKKQLVMQNFDKTILLRIRFDYENFESNILNDHIGTIQELFPTSNMEIDLTRCNNHFVILNLVDLNITVLNKIKSIFLKKEIIEKLIIRYMMTQKNATMITQNKKLWKILNYAVDQERCSFLYGYILGIKKHTDKRPAILPFVQHAAVAKEVFNIINHDTLDNKFPHTPDNLLKNVLLNMRLALNPRNQNLPCSDPMKDFFPEFKKKIDPRYFWPYLSTLERENDPILEEIKECGFQPLLDWLSDERQKHIEEHGFNLQESIIKYIETKYLTIKNENNLEKN